MVMIAPSNMKEFSSHLQVIKTCIKSRTISNFGQMGLLSSELSDLERHSFPYILIIEKMLWTQ